MDATIAYRISIGCPHATQHITIATKKADIAGPAIQFGIDLSCRCVSGRLLPLPTNLCRHVILILFRDIVGGGGTIGCRICGGI